MVIKEEGRGFYFVPGMGHGYEQRFAVYLAALTSVLTVSFLVSSHGSRIG